MRFIDLGPIDLPRLHATEEAVAVSGEPTFMLWVARPSTVNLGYFSSYKDEVDIDAAEKLGLPITRRPSGGGTVLFDDRQLCYSIVAKWDSGILPRGAKACFLKAADGLINALQDTWGMEAEFAGKNDIVVEGKKISGNAQTNKHQAKIQHGTFLLDFDYETAAQVLKIPVEKVVDKGIGVGPTIEMIKGRVTTLKEVLGREVPKDEAKRALRKGFEKALDVEFVEGGLKPEESEMVTQLTSKYEDPEWIFRR